MAQPRTTRTRAVRLVVSAALVASGLGLAVQAGTVPAVAADTPQLPDLQTRIPLGDFGIAKGESPRELRYTHRIYNYGTGPLQIRPFLRGSSGDYLGRQELLDWDRSTSGDDDSDWHVVAGTERPVPDAFFYHAEHGHFHFPLATFGLYEVDANGDPGAPVTMSPKIGFCIANSGIDNTVDHAGIGQWGNCADPTSLRGLSIGGYDEYDYRDPGQAIPLTGVPDGRYWFRAVSDPNNDFVESDESNNEEDVKIRISGSRVSVLGSPRTPDTTPCTAQLTTDFASPVAGVVTWKAQTSAVNPTAVSYFVDGKYATSSSGPAPYSRAWDSSKVVDGEHWMSARVRQADGRACSTPVVDVTVDNADGSGGAEPRITFTDPEAGGTVEGRAALAVNVADSSPVTSVRFRVDGKAVGSPDTTAPYAVIWNSRTVHSGSHTVTAVAEDEAGRTNTSTRAIKVHWVPAPKVVAVDRSAETHGKGALRTAGISTRDSSEVVVALVSYDGPAGADQQSATVSGAGLTWHLVKRSSSQSGDAEIWAARTSRRLVGNTVRATPRAGGYDGMLTVYTFRNAERTGIASAAGAPSGAPDFYAPAVSEGSLVFAAGTDWDGAAARVPIAGQVVPHQWLDPIGGTYWVQRLTAPTTAQRLISITDTAPTDHQWNYVAVEVKAQH